MIASRLASIPRLNDPAFHLARGAPGRRGLTLVEVMLAVAILTIVALSTAALVVPISRQARIGREMDVADAEVRCILEKVHALPFSTVTALYPDNAEIAVAGLRAGKIVVSYEDVAADPLVMFVDLTWDSPNMGPMSRRFATVMTR